MGLGFQGDVADFYHRYRRGYPAPVFDALAAAVHLADTDVTLDIGCGTGQLTLPMAERVRAAIGMDPEPDMLERAREAARERGTANVSWLLGADTDVPALGAVLGAGALGVVTIGQALHYMNAGELIDGLVPYLRPGGGVAVVTNGLPTWLHDNTWSPALRDFLQRWTGGPVSNACGTDAASQQCYAEVLRAAGLTVSQIRIEYRDTLDFEHLLGGVYSAFSVDMLPAPDVRPAFAEQLRAALPAADTYVEDVRVAILLGVLDGPVTDRRRARRAASG